MLLLLLVALLMAGCSPSPGSGGPAGPPVKDGDTLAYHLTKTDHRANPKSEESDLLLTFLPGGELGLGEDKKPIARLDAELAPVDGQPLTEADLGLVYLPPSARKANTSTRAGMVQFEKRWERWSCWVVNVREGDLSGQRYYESRTGVLVGYELNLDHPDPGKAFFRKAILTRTDIAGLL